MPDINEIKPVLASAALGLSEPDKAADAFRIIHGLTDLQGFLDTAPELKKLLPAELIDPIQKEAEGALIGGKFEEGSVRRALALAVLQCGTRMEVARVLEALAEDEVKEGIYVVAGAVEAISGIKLGDETGGQITKLCGLDASLWAKRDDAFRQFAREIIELRIAKPGDVRPRNLLKIVNPSHDIAVFCRAVLENVKAALGETEVPSGKPSAMPEAPAPAATPAGTTKPAQPRPTRPKAKTPPDVPPPAPSDKPTAQAEPAPSADGEKPTGHSVIGDIIQKTMFKPAEAVKIYGKITNLQEKEAVNTAIRARIAKARETIDAMVFAYLLAFAKCTGITVEPPVTEEEVGRMYKELIIKKASLQIIGRFAGIAAINFPDVTGVKKGDQKTFEKKWQPVPGDYPQLLTPKEKSAHDSVRDFLRTDQPLQWDEILALTDTDVHQASAYVLAWHLVNGGPGKVFIDELMQKAAVTAAHQDRQLSLRTICQKAVPLFVHDESVKFPQIKALRMRLGNATDEFNKSEPCDRLSRELTIYLGTNCKQDIGPDRIAALDRMEAYIERFVCSDVLANPEEMSALIENLIQEGVKRIGRYPDRSAGWMAEANNAAAALHNLHENLTWRNKLPKRFYPAYREVSKTLLEADPHTQQAITSLRHELELLDFPDGSCERENVRRCLGPRSGNTPLRTAAKDCVSREAKECFIILMKIEADNASAIFDALTYLAERPKELNAIQRAMDCLIRVGLLSPTDLQNALNASSLGKTDNDWGALQPTEQQAIEQMLKTLSLQMPSAA